MNEKNDRILDRGENFDSSSALFLPFKTKNQALSEHGSGTVDGFGASAVFILKIVDGMKNVDIEVHYGGIRYDRRFGLARQVLHEM